MSKLEARPAGVGAEGAAPEMDWSDWAACRSEDPELFFPHPTDEATAMAAKSVCQVCPVMDECLSWALATRQEFGVWGGMTEKERHKRRERLRRARERQREKERKQAAALAAGAGVAAAA